MPERALSAAPKAVMLALALSVCAQTGWHAGAPSPRARAEALDAPPSRQALRLASLGEPVAAAGLLTLYLQAFDNQPGIQIPFRDLDYARVVSWLERLLDLDPESQYPLFMATQLYAQVADESKQRQMLDFAYREFLADPNRRWRALAYAAILAKHRLHDQPLALKYAQAISERATAKDVPHWASQMRIFILEDMGELESAKILLGALIAEGAITDPHEKLFLNQHYLELEARSAEKSSTPSK